MRPSLQNVLYSVITITLLAATHTTDTRIGGYSHRNAPPPQAAQSRIPAENEPTPVQTQEPMPQIKKLTTAEQFPLPVNDAIAQTQSYAQASIPRSRELPPPPRADNIYELMSMLETQNKQLRDQIALLEREGSLLLRKNRSLLADKRRLQRKKRKLSEKVDSLEEQILKAASRPLRPLDGRPPRYSQRSSRSK